MITFVKIGAAAVVVAVAMSAVALAQAPAQRKVTTDQDGVIHITDGMMPPSSILSDEAKRVLAAQRGGGPAPAPAEQSVSMAERRAKMNADLQPRVAHMRELYPVDIEETTIDGISVAVVTPKGGVPERNKNRIMLNVPGGGFTTGIRANGLFFSIPAASLGQMKVVTALYRQGPEDRFPAATEDFMKVYKWALKDHNPKAIGMFGCSAGGALVAQTIAAALLSGMPAPGAAGIYCSGASARFDGDSNNFGQLLSNGGSANTKNVIASGPGQYFDGIDATQPAASPVNDLALLAKFPPTIFATGTRDFAMSQAAFAHRQLLKVGVDTDLLIYDGLGHGFMTNPDIPESRDFYELTIKFFDRHLAR
jgi:monoterpene epsilon-lactone hydrolase